MKYERFILAAGLGALLIMGAACSRETSEKASVTSSGDGKGTAPASAEVKKEDQALVRFVNATPSSKDLAFGATTPFSNVKAGDATEYMSLPAKRNDFKLYVNGDNSKTVATDSEGLDAGKHYTVVAETEKDGTFTLKNIADDLTPPKAGNAKVRVINLDPAVKDVDLYSSITKSAIVTGVGLDHATNYENIEPTDGSLDIRNTASKKDDQPVKDLEMQAGKLYTILVFGDKNGKLKVKTIEDVFNTAS
jgi:hypothetical protein